MRRLPGVAVLLALLVPVAALLLLEMAGGGTIGGLPAAATASLLATALGTAAGTGLRAGFPGRGVAAAITLLPWLLPPVIPAAALALLAGEEGIAPIAGVIVAEALLGAPVVALVVWLALGRADPALARAAAACGAPPGLAARRLLRPVLLRAAGCAALAFALSAGSGMAGAGSFMASAAALAFAVLFRPAARG